MQGDSGYDHYCTYGGEKRDTGSFAANTPEWCPVDGAAVEPSDALSEYIKDGESVAQCIQRNRDDVSQALGLLSKAQRDATRYRWLRTNINANVQVLFEDEGGHTFDYNDEDFDEAVDALMVKSPHGECPTGDYERAGVVAPKGNASESPALSQPPSDLLNAVGIAYGWLWHVNNMPEVPTGVTPDQASYKARHALRDLLSHEQRGEYINRVAMLIRESETKSEPKCSDCKDTGVIEGGEGYVSEVCLQCDAHEKEFKRLTGQSAETSARCRKCGGEMQLGKALQPTARAGIPDFPGQVDMRGQTVCMGPGVLVDAWKCKSCGHSYTAESENRT